MRRTRLVLLLLLLAACLAWGYPALRRLVSGPADETAPTLPALPELPPELTELLTLPYATGMRDDHPERRGVLLYDRERAWPGLNLYFSKRESRAFLVDMEGNVVHRWQYGDQIWFHVQLLPNGDLVVSLSPGNLMRLDAQSNLLWSLPGHAHHDFWVERDSEETWLAESRRILAPRICTGLPIADNTLQRVTRDGRRVGGPLSVLELIQGSAYEDLLPRVELPEGVPLPWLLDPLHLNHVEVFDGALADRSPLFAKGNVLLSLRSLDAILIADPELQRILWLWGPGTLRRQHDPQLLANGHLLVFDNGEELSRILEVDPLTDEITWSYGPVEGFFSATEGSVQRLPNGNTLITETQSGSVFEVTPRGDVVWEFANHDVDEEGVRGSIWRMTRFSADDLPFLEAQQPASGATAGRDSLPPPGGTRER